MPLTPVPLSAVPSSAVPSSAVPSSAVPSSAVPTARTPAASLRPTVGSAAVPTRADPVDILAGRAGSPLKALDPALSESLVEAREAMEKTLETVEKAVRDDDEMRKAAALEKVRMLRARLQTLTMTAANDPEGAAREAARIARDLASAVRAYVSAGGSATDIGGLALRSPAAAPAAVPGDVVEAEETAVASQPPPSLWQAGAEARAEAHARAVDARDERLGFVREVRAMMQGLRDILDFAERRRDEDDRDTARVVRDGLAALRGMTQDVGRLTHQPVTVIV